MKPQGMELLQGRDYVAMQEEVLTVSEMNRTYYSYDEALGRNRILSDYDKVPSYNWQDQVFRNAPMTSHHISLTGGTKNTKYSSSLSYYNQQGIIINSSYESLKARLTLDQQITRKVKFGGSLNFANNISKVRRLHRVLTQVVRSIFYIRYWLIVRCFMPIRKNRRTLC